MIYSIGYDGGLSIPTLQTLLARLDAVLCDVRSLPSSRIPGFHGTTLKSTFGTRYLHLPQLGGIDVNASGVALKIAPEDIRALALSAQSAHVLIMCKEHAPCDCHRHRTVAAPLWAMHGTDVFHLMPDDGLRWDAPGATPCVFPESGWDGEWEGEHDNTQTLDQHLKGR